MIYEKAMIKNAVILCLFCWAGTLYGLTPYQATYSLYYYGVKAGTVTQVLKPLPHNKYLFSNTVEPILTLLPYGGFERSIFKMTPQTIIPLQYAFEKQQGSFEEGNITFDEKNKLAKESSTKHSGNLPFASDTHDKQTYFIQLARDLMAGKKTLKYTIVGDGKIRKYNFVPMGNEILPTALGDLKTLKLKQTSQDKSRVTYLWLDPTRDYLLVRVLQERKGNLAGESTIETYQKQPL